MAAATRFENIHIIADATTISGVARIYLVLTGGSAAATLTLTIGSDALVLKAPAGESVSLPAFIKIGKENTATFSLSGSGATAYAIECLDL